MRDKREIKNATIATVIGGLLLTILLWCVNHFSELQSKLLNALSTWVDWSHASALWPFAILLLFLLWVRRWLRPTLKSKVIAYRKKITRLFGLR